jgi:hypothetical protein
MNFTKNQSGFMGAIEILLIVVLIGVIGFASTKVYNSARSADASNKEAIDVAEKTADYKPASSIKEATEPVVTETKEPTETIEVKTEAPVEVVKDKPVTIKFTKGGGSQQGNNVVVSAWLESTQTGTCS